MAAPQQLSNALLEFSIDGRFPDDISSLPPVSDTDLGPAIEALAANKTELEVRCRGQLYLGAFSSRDTRAKCTP